MSSSEKKEVLQKYQPILKDIKRKMMEMKRWKDVTQKADSGAELQSLLVDKLVEEVERLMEKKQYIEKLIGAVENYTHRLLLESRYLDGKTWEEVADYMNYSWQHLHRIHKRAIDELPLHQ